jgi:flagellar motor switch/type III secretory pathway protein FliN
LAVAILVPATGELLPAWCATPDEAGHGKLRTLAQELSLLVLPETYVPDKFEAVPVSQLAAALQTAGAEEASAVVRLTLKSEGKESEALIVWPLTHAANLTHPQQEKGDQTAAVEPDAVDADRVTDDEAGDDGMEIETERNWPTSVAEVRLGPSLRDLPLYTRSLLKIRVPISVTLAAKKQPVAQILEIGPGSILQFEKSCEDMLDLNVSNLPIARGEAVKVGDKFGLRVTSLILPGERFKPIQPPQEKASNTP